MDDDHTMDLEWELIKLIQNDCYQTKNTANGTMSEHGVDLIAIDIIYNGHKLKIIPHIRQTH